MWEFLHTYGMWILFGLLFLQLMLMQSGGMRGMGGGCGMEHDQYDEASDRRRAVPLDEYTDTQRAVPLEAEYFDGVRSELVHGEYTDPQRSPLARQDIGQEEKAVAERYSSRHHSRGC